MEYSGARSRSYFQLKKEKCEHKKCVVLFPSAECKYEKVPFIHSSSMELEADSVYISRNRIIIYTRSQEKAFGSGKKHIHTVCHTIYEVRALFAKYYINLYRKAFSCYLLICTPMDPIRGGFNVPMCALYACVRVLRLIS